MIGRDNELDAITAAATGVADRGCALVVEGEPGVGKTTLLTTVTAWAKRQGFTVLSCAGVQTHASLL